MNLLFLVLFLSTLYSCRRTHIKNTKHIISSHEKLVVELVVHVATSFIKGNFFLLYSFTLLVVQKLLCFFR